MRMYLNISKKVQSCIEVLHTQRQKERVLMCVFLLRRTISIRLHFTLVKSGPYHISYREFSRELPCFAALPQYKNRKKPSKHDSILTCQNFGPYITFLTVKIHVN